jgi:hypothetical protein
LVVTVLLAAVGASLTAVTFTVIVLADALSASPSFTVKLKVVYEIHFHLQLDLISIY